MCVCVCVYVGVCVCVTRHTNQQRACFKVYITLHHFLSISLDEQWSIMGHILLLHKNCTIIVCTKHA